MDRNWFLVLVAPLVIGCALLPEPADHPARPDMGLNRSRCAHYEYCDFMAHGWGPLW
jgi:hypothetical protein